MVNSSSSDLSSSFLPSTPASTTKSEDAAIRQHDKLPQALEKRVLDATSQLSGDKCIIRNTRDSTCYSYVLSRSTPENIITRLEYSWGLTYGQLNVDSSSNVLLISSDLRKSFHRNLWILIPEDRTILSIYRRHKKRGPKENDFAELLPSGPYKYKFIASRYLKRSTIERLPDASDNEKEIPGRSYSYPFTDFPTIVSHVHPRFVVYHAGRALLKNQYDFLIARPDLQNIVPKLISIYKTWTNPIPSGDIKSFVRIRTPLIYGGDGRDAGRDVSDTSSVTRAERFNWRTTEPPNTADGQPNINMDRGTLLVLDALVPPDTPKTETISRWLAAVPTSPNEFDINPLSATPLS